MAPKSGMKTSDDAKVFLQMLRKQIDQNLQHYQAGESPMTKKEVFEISQFEYDHEFEDDIHSYGINVKSIFHNAAPAVLYEQALAHEPGSYISNTGALMVSSGVKTGRSPADKRIVEEPSSVNDVWWGKVNMKLSEQSYLTNRERALDYLNLQEQLYVVDAYAGWDTRFRVNIRVITTRAYHALFMQNMLVMPKPEDLRDFKPDFIIYNAGCFPANRYTEGVSSQTSVALNLARKEMVILGTQYAGEMKKGVLTLMMYLMPKAGQLPLHSSANLGPKGDVSLFFGLSGTGKTTLSADPARQLIGDDEHVWTDKGVFNVEGGCYAKCVDLTREKEPDIYDALRFGALLENVVFDGQDRKPDYFDITVTENTRASYPLSYIKNSLIPSIVDTHPSNVVLLTCDAFGVLPPVSKLTSNQVVYHFISGYTSKVAGTEIGITEPQATFSSCYGSPFLVLHPNVYATMLAKKLAEHNANAWLVNTGWVGGSAKAGAKRCPLPYTRKIIDAIHDGSLARAEFIDIPIFGLKVPKKVAGVPDDLLDPSKGWKDAEAFRAESKKLAQLFVDNFKQYQDKTSPEVLSAGPQVPK